MIKQYTHSLAATAHETEKYTEVWDIVKREGIFYKIGHFYSVIWHLLWNSYNTLFSTTDIYLYTKMLC